MQNLPIEAAFNAALAKLPPLSSLMAIATRGLDGSVTHTYTVHVPGGTSARFARLPDLLACLLKPAEARRLAALARVAELKAEIIQVQETLPT